MSPRHMLDQQWQVFKGLDLQGKTILDVGAGAGYASCYAIALGAQSVIALEPEAGGSQLGMVRQAHVLRDEMGYADRIQIIPTTFEASGIRSQFDIVLLNASINHVNEDACALLPDDRRARAIYLAFFEKLAQVCKPGGLLVITDCSNSNVFPALGLPNPVMKTIDWRIHQPPEVWASLLSRAGFIHPRIDWTPLTSMGWVGRVLGSKKFINYFINSAFRLVMESPRSRG